MQRWVGWVAILVVVAAAYACGDSEGSSGDGGSGDGGSGGTAGSGGAPTGGGPATTGGGGGGPQGCDAMACTECSDCSIADVCKMQNDTCTANAECGLYGACFNACGADQACFDTCAMMHPDGKSDYEALINCVCAQCTTACASNPLCANIGG